MQELRQVELDALQDIVGDDRGVEELSDNDTELKRQLEAALEKPDVAAVVVFPLQRKRRRFPIPPRTL